MKILQVINSLDYGGAEKLVVEMAILLKKTNFDVEVLLIHRSKSDYEKRLQENGVVVNSLDVGNYYNPVVVYKLFKYINRYDLIHVHLFPLQYWVVIAKMLSFSSTPLVTTEHSTFNRRRSIRGFRLLDRIIYRAYKKIISISKETQEDLCQYLKRQDACFAVINNGIDVCAYQQAEGYSKEELLHVDNSIKIITMVGLFRQAKDQDTLIRAISRLDAKVHLVLVGDGERKNALVNLVKDLKLEGRVHFWGRRNDVPQIMKMSDIVVQSSHWEGFGLAAVEGMAAGKPVVASDVPGLSDVVRGAGCLFKPQQEDQLANILFRLLSDNVYYKQVCEACERRAQQYDKNWMIQDYIRVYETVAQDEKNH